MKTCSVDGCERAGRLSRGLCPMHYARWRRHGSTDSLRAERGSAQRFIELALTHESDDCLEWPYQRHSFGYGLIDIDGRSYTAHRVVCAATHGPPPSPEHQAAHGCGNPPCVNPRHLRWATPKENSGDMIGHGTRRMGETVPNAHRTTAEVLMIRSEHAAGVSQADLARRFDTSIVNIHNIVRRKTWRHLPEGASCS